MLWNHLIVVVVVLWLAIEQLLLTLARVTSTSIVIEDVIVGVIVGLSSFSWLHRAVRLLVAIKLDLLTHAVLHVLLPINIDDVLLLL